MNKNHHFKEIIRKYKYLSLKRKIFNIFKNIKKK